MISYPVLQTACMLAPRDLRLLKLSYCNSLYVKKCFDFINKDNVTHSHILEHLSYLFHLPITTEPWLEDSINHVGNYALFRHWMFCPIDSFTFFVFCFTFTCLFSEYIPVFYLPVNSMLGKGRIYFTWLYSQDCLKAQNY